MIPLKSLMTVFLAILFAANAAGAENVTMSGIGQKKFIVSKTLTFKDGLSSNRIKDITRDSLGAYWIGTERGLDRIMEGSVVNYKGTKGLDGKEILFVTTDTSGRLWAGTADGLFLYDFTSDSFSAMYAEGLPLYPIFYDIYPDGIVFSTTTGIIRYKNGTDIPEILVKRIKNVPDNSYCTLSLQDSTRAIAISKTGEILSIDLKTGKLEKIFSIGSRSFIKDACLDSNGNLWVAVYDTGLYCISIKEKKVSASFSVHDSFLEGCIILDIEIHGDKLWVSTDGKGIFLINIIDFTVANIESELSYKMPEEVMSVNSIFKHGDELWLGTIRHGIVQLSKSSIRSFCEKDFFPGKIPNVNSSTVQAICEDRHGKIWIGTDGGGITVYDPVSKIFNSLANLENEKIVAIECIDRSRMLLSIYYKGIYEYDTLSGKMKKIPIIDSINETRILNLDLIIGLKRLANGDILVLANDIYIYDHHTGKIHESGINIHDGRSFKVASMQKDTAILYTSSVIYRISLRDKKAQRLFLSPSGDINCVRLSGGTLYIIQGHSMSSLKLDSMEYMRSPFIHNSGLLTIETGQKGTLWTATQDMLIRIDGEYGKSCTIFGKENGVSPNEFISGVSLMACDGTIYFGGNTGLCVVRESALQSEEPHNISIMSVRLDTDMREKSGNSTSSVITVPWDYESLKINVCLNGADPFSRHKFRYTITGRNQSAIYSDNTLSLPALAPGSYNIDIAYLSPKDEWIEDKSVMKVHVQAPWWQSFVFIAGIMILLTVGGALTAYLYHRREKIKAARLYRQRKEKLAENKISFLTNISHELRTPLTLIYAPLKRLMEKDTGSSGIQKSDLSGILAQTKYMISLINMVLDSRKLEEGYGKLNLQPHDLNAWLQATVNEFRSEYESKGISIRLEADEKISSVTYDEGKFHIILSNLLMNAWKYSEPHTEVTVRSSEKDGRIRIEVSDQGIGINGVDTETLFGRFVQAHKQSNGFGLGLAYTKQLVEAHPGGTIGAFPNKSQGSTFWFEIPEGLQGDTQGMARGTIESEDYETPVQDSAEPQEAAREDNIINIDTSAYSVLIAEDEPELLMFLKQELSGSFKKVYAAPDGKEAYGMALKTIPDIIVSDVMMPFMDGYELCRKIKNDIKVSHIPVILLTAQAEQGHRAEGYKSGADIFLAKPFDIPTLISAIRNTLYSREMIKEKYRNLSTVPVSVAEDTFSNADEQFMLKIDKFIEENISNDSLNAQMIAEYACMGRASFYKKVKEILGIGIMEYVTRKRMALAARLLTGTHLQVSEIALKAGYPDNQYFSRAFKQHFGQSPSTYRKGNAG